MSFWNIPYPTFSLAIATLFQQPTGPWSQLKRKTLTLRHWINMPHTHGIPHIYCISQPFRQAIFQKVSQAKHCCDFDFLSNCDGHWYFTYLNLKVWMILWLDSQVVNLIIMKGSRANLMDNLYTTKIRLLDDSEISYDFRVSKFSI